MDAGAENLSREGENYEILTPPDGFDAVKGALEKASLRWESAELRPIPEVQIPVADTDTARKLQLLMDGLEDLDDVQAVYENSKFSDQILNELQESD